jgi:CubicO group peptidase (beta-lactamase class C family)
MRCMRFALIFLFVALAVPPLSAAAESTCSEPVLRKDGWSAAKPESVGLSSSVLCSMVPRLEASKDDDVHAVLVIRHGRLVFEQYFTGADEHLGRAAGVVTFGPEIRHDERSVTKTVTGLLIGIAIDHRWIKGVDEPVLKFFPEYPDLATPDKNRITLRDLLTMSSGLEWHEFGIPYTSTANSEIAMDTSTDPYRYALAPKVVASPGEVWNYSSGSAELLGAVLRKATEKPLDQLAHELLFKPLGIEDVEWYPYPKGNVSAAAGLRMRPRDLAKIGQLILQKGTWNGKRLVPESWIRSMISPQINGFDLYFYGYQIWLGRSLAKGREILWAAAIGNGAQRVIIVPELDLVMVLNAGLYESPRQASLPTEILNRYVLKAVN